MATRKKAKSKPKKKTAKPARKKAKPKTRKKKAPKVEAAHTKDEVWISYERLDEIVFAPRNAKNHDVGLLTQSIDRFGFVEPPAINETTGRLVTGHGRIKGLRALKQAGKPLPEKVKIADDGEWLAPVIRGNTFPTDQEAEAYLMTSNRSQQLGGYHDPILVEMLADHAAITDGLLGTGYDLEDLDFLRERLDENLSELGDGKPDPPDPQLDRADELRKKWKVKRGQVWNLGGRHRVMCGDSTSAEDVALTLGGSKPFIMVTDPPYGVNYDPKWRDEAAKKGLIRYGATSLGVVENDDRADWTEAWALFAGDVAYVWHAGLQSGPVAGHLAATGLIVRSQIIWRKAAFCISRGHYHGQHEPCWYAARKGRTAKWSGDRSQSTVWDIAGRHSMSGDRTGPDESTGHSTQKPVECMARPIRHHGEKGDIVYDPFLGSGTTLIAAVLEGRVCYGMEISPAYVAVTLQRWADQTGETPKLMKS